MYYYAQGMIEKYKDRIESMYLKERLSPLEISKKLRIPLITLNKYISKSGLANEKKGFSIENAETKTEKHKNSNMNITDIINQRYGNGKYVNLSKYGQIHKGDYLNVKGKKQLVTGVYPFLVTVREEVVVLRASQGCDVSFIETSYRYNEIDTDLNVIF